MFDEFLDLLIDAAEPSWRVPVLLVVPVRQVRARAEAARALQTARRRPVPLYMRVADCLLPFVLIAVVLQDRRQRGVRLGERDRGAAQLARAARSACGAPSTAGSSRRAARSPRARSRQGSAAAARRIRGAAGAGGGGDRPHDQRRDARLQPGAAVAVDRDRAGLADRPPGVPQAARERPWRKASAARSTLPEPGTVDYARSFFPVAFIVLIVRAFIFEPFRIPSDSMMPTLLDGDFIVVNKFAYGLRWPVRQREIPRHRHAAAR